MSDVTASYETLLDFIAFLGILLHCWLLLMYEVLYHIKKSCVLSIHTFLYVYMPNVTTTYGWFFGLIGFFLEISKFNTILWRKAECQKAESKIGGK